MKKLIKIFVVMMMLVGLAIPMTKVSAATIKLSKTEIKFNAALEVDSLKLENVKSAAVKWSCSDPELVDICIDNLADHSDVTLTCLKNTDTTAYIYAEYDGVRYSCKIIVGKGGADEKPVPALTKKSLKIKAGESAVLRIENAEGTIKWSSSNKKVAKVDGKGSKVNIVAIAKGSATIKCKVGGKTYKCKVKVTVPSGSGTTTASVTIYDVSTQKYVTKTGTYEGQMTGGLPNGEGIFTIKNSDGTVSYIKGQFENGNTVYASIYSDNNDNSETQRFEQDSTGAYVYTDGYISVTKNGNFTETKYYLKGSYLFVFEMGSNSKYNAYHYIVGKGKQSKNIYEMLHSGDTIVKESTKYFPNSELPYNVGRFTPEEVIKLTLAYDTSHKTIKKQATLVKDLYQLAFNKYDEVSRKTDDTIKMNNLKVEACYGSTSRNGMRLYKLHISGKDIPALNDDYFVKVDDAYFWMYVDTSKLSDAEYAKLPKVGATSTWTFMLIDQIHVYGPIYEGHVENWAHHYYRYTATRSDYMCIAYFGE